MNRALVIFTLFNAVVLPSHAAQTLPPAPPTLESALRAMHPLQDSVAVAVAAAKVHLPKGSILPDHGANTDETADAFGMIIEPFGSVLAVAPRTMTVVYAPPDTPNPYDGMPPAQVLKMLARTWTPAQWKDFLSEAGVGYLSMADVTQQKLFQALFPSGHLIAQLNNPTGENDPNAKQDISGDALLQAHLRIGYTVAIALPLLGNAKGDHVFAGSWNPPNSPPRYFMMNAQSSSVDHEFGAAVRETLPNVTKVDKLPQELQHIAISLDNLKTVDDLIARISSAAHAEIYADPRYGSRLLTILGTPQTAQSDNLLKAIALCVRGTYRKVGPAYVLTDDQIGLGTKHVLWKAFEDKAARMLPGQNMVSRFAPLENQPYTLKDIKFYGDLLALSPEQTSSYWKQLAVDAINSYGDTIHLALPFDQLTTAQQDAAQHTQVENTKEKLNTTLDGTIELQADPNLQIVLPGLDGPVVVFRSIEQLLPEPARPPAQEAAHKKRLEAEFPQILGTSRVTTTANTVRNAMLRFPHRAVRIAAVDLTTLTHSLTLAHADGFNEVWLQMQPDNASPDLLTQAVKLGKPLGLAILPDITLLRWHTPTAEMRDLNIIGKSPSEPIVTRFGDSEIGYDTVTPFGPNVLQTLQATVKALANIPGIGGMVWDDITPPGYGNDIRGSEEGIHAPLGYAEAGRLASLRSSHVDPVDLYNNSYSDERAHVTVPGFDDSDFDTTSTLFRNWALLKRQTAISIAQRLAQALPTTFRVPGRLPLIVPPRNSSYSYLYGTWDNFKVPLPTVQYLSQKGPDGTPIMGASATEQMTSKMQYMTSDNYTASGIRMFGLVYIVMEGLQKATKSGARCVMFDAVTNPEMLSDLAEGFAKPKAANRSAGH